jgi:pimeloyl-ACP methyl ester carboxylesterase
MGGAGREGSAEPPVSTGIRRGYARACWGQIHYRAAGSQGPCIVMLHESPLSSAMFEPVLPFLDCTTRVWALDTPGCGLSDPPPQPVDIPEYARALIQAIQWLGLREYTLVGFHTGASLAVQIALLERSATVSGVILSGVPVLSDAERRSYLESWAPPLKISSDGKHLRWAWDRFTTIWEGPADLIHYGTSEMLSNLERYHWAYNAAFRYDPAPDLPHIACPTLLLSAEHDKMKTCDDRAFRLLRNASRLIVANAKMPLPLRQPELVSRIILEFLSDCGVPPWHTPS